jgi:hypothetical protein
MSDERKEESSREPEPEKPQSPAGTEWPVTINAIDSWPETGVAINTEEMPKKP